MAKPRARLGARPSELGGRPRRRAETWRETGRGDGAGRVKRRAPPQERGATRTRAGGLPRDARGLQASSGPARRLRPRAPGLPVRRVLPVLGSAYGVWIPGSACRERECQPTSSGPHGAAPAGPQPRVVADCQLRAHCTVGRLTRAHRAEVGRVPPMCRRGRSSRAVALCVGCERGFWARRGLGPGAAVLSEVSVCPQRPLQCVPCTGPGTHSCLHQAWRPERLPFIHSAHPPLLPWALALAILSLNSIANTQKATQM